jgi:hypothetical protein
LFLCFGTYFSKAKDEKTKPTFTMKTTHLLFLVSFFYLWGISNLAATPKEPARISGKISDQQGKPIPFANIALISIEGGLVDGAVSDEDVFFRIESIKTARVRLVASSIGYKSRTIEEFDLYPDLKKDIGNQLLVN